VARRARPHRVFLLSPAHAAGVRAALLLRPAARFPLARALREPPGAPLGEAFAFMSGLYFRGKLAYAAAFARPPEGVAGALVIAPGRGLVAAAAPVTAGDLRELAAVPVDPLDPRFREPLARDAGELARRLGPSGEAVLLGSIASPRYSLVLLGALGPRLRFPPAFVGRGDMSRGGLLLRCVRAGEELAYAPLEGAVLRGPRPPRLPPAGRGLARRQMSDLRGRSPAGNTPRR
jgi:hypothetical protein